MLFPRTLPKAIGLVGGLLVTLTLWWWLAPPELIRVGAGYTAKIVCSNVFIAARDPVEVLKTDVQAPGHPLLRLMRVSVDRERHVVRAGLMGFLGNGLAVFRPGAGCTVVPDGKWEALRATDSVLPPGGASVAKSNLDGHAEWPSGEGDVRQPDAGVARVIDNDVFAGPGMRAVVVIHEGHLIAERYARGFDRRTPQLGWSMTKTVTAGLVGILVKDGRLTLNQSAGLKGGGREKVRVADLLAMSSGLEFNEGYGAVSDVTRMLYLEPDMAAFAGSKPLIHGVGDTWSYSSGSAVIVSRVFQDAAGPRALWLARTRLFDILGMTSAVIETDEKGTLVGSSYMYATPRDWARYGQFLLQDGMWQRQEILPRGYVAMMVSPVEASGGEYGHGLLWRWATHSDKPGENPDFSMVIPADTFWMLGHDGQSVAVIPSRELVIVRMGLTPARTDYRPEPLVQAVLRAVTSDPRVKPVSGVRDESPQ
jgi:CubicO group peptidase (beta-lactamase class C family)